MGLWWGMMKHTEGDCEAMGETNHEDLGETQQMEIILVNAQVYLRDFSWRSWVGDPDSSQTKTPKILKRWRLNPVYAMVIDLDEFCTSDSKQMMTGKKTKNGERTTSLVNGIIQGSCRQKLSWIKIDFLKQHTEPMELKTHECLGRNMPIDPFSCTPRPTRSARERIGNMSERECDQWYQWPMVSNN